MVELIFSMAFSGAIQSWPIPTSYTVIDGWATRYGLEVMEQVAVNRLLISDIADYDIFLEAQGLAGMVALNRAGDLWRRVWLEGPKGIEGPFLVVDCARALDYPQRLADSRVVEVDWPTSRRWGMAGPIPVRVFFQDPEDPLVRESDVPAGPLPRSRERRVSSPGKVHSPQPL